MPTYSSQGSSNPTRSTFQVSSSWRIQESHLNIRTSHCSLSSTSRLAAWCSEPHKPYHCEAPCAPSDARSSKQALQTHLHHGQLPQQCYKRIPVRLSTRSRHRRCCRLRTAERAAGACMAVCAQRRRILGSLGQNRRHGPRHTAECCTSALQQSVARAPCRLETD